jgi:hypothetical protein
VNPGSRFTLFRFTPLRPGEGPGVRLIKEIFGQESAVRRRGRG